MKLEALDHPKTMDLAARLNVELPTAIGYLELLWAFTGKKSPQGNIGKWPDGAIARACYWMGRPEVFILALHESGFIDADDVYRFTVHDWRDHAPGWVRAKLKKLGLVFIQSSDATRERSSEPSSEPSLEPSIQGKGSTSTSEGKGREVSRGARATRLPDDFSLTDERRLVAEVEKLPAERTFAKFCDYWHSASGAKARKLDWDATWRNWCRTEADRCGPKFSGNGAHAPATQPVKSRSADELEDDVIVAAVRKGLSDGEILSMDELACAPNLPARIRAKRDELQHAQH